MGIYYGDLFADYMHPECKLAMGNSDFGYEEEFDPMCQKRGKTLEESHE